MSRFPKHYYSHFPTGLGCFVIEGSQTLALTVKALCGFWCLGMEKDTLPFTPQRLFSSHRLGLEKELCSFALRNMDSQQWIVVYHDTDRSIPRTILNQNLLHRFWWIVLLILSAAGVRGGRKRETVGGKHGKGPEEDGADRDHRQTKPLSLITSCVI